MEIKRQIEIIQKATGWTQAETAVKLGVTFAALNRWVNQHAVPREKQKKKIRELYLEITGQKEVPAGELAAQKLALLQKRKKHKNILGEILGRKDVYEQFVLELTYNSNSIEGSTLTEDETADILFQNRTFPNKSLTEHLEAKNHQTALEYLFRQHLGEKKPIDEALAAKLHGILMSGIRDDTGTYRYHGVRIVGANVPTANYLKVPDLMVELFWEISRIGKQIKNTGKKNTGNADADMVNAVSRIHARFEQIHPFSDGNGRVGRMLANAMLLHANFAPAIIKQEDRRKYYIALHKAQMKEDPSLLEFFFAQAIEGGFELLEEEGKSHGSGATT